MRANSDFLSMGLQDGALIFRLVVDKHPAKTEMELLQDEIGLKKKVY